MSSINKREWQKREKAKNRRHISLKNNSHVFCHQIGRAKFLYENETKARVALKFNRKIGVIRYYVCNRCMGYHLTKMTVVEYKKSRELYLTQSAHIVQ